MKLLAQKRKKIFLQENTPNLNETSPFDNFYYKEIAKMTAAGGWSIDFIEKKSFLDPEGRRILKTPEGYRLSLKNALEFYAPENKEKAARIFMECSTGVPFSTTIKMLTYDKKEFWAQAIGKPVFDENKNVIGMQGVFQDIDSKKLKELNLEQSLKIIESQNSRLLNFAHIVSHNLRSHASNLQLTLELLEAIDSEEEEKELKESLSLISKGLNVTMDHLNELVSIHSKSGDDKKPVKMEGTLQSVVHSLNHMVLHTNAEIYSDFTEVPEIQYIPSYMESILLNLITNAIKYKHPDRNPVVDICTYTENGHSYLMIKDNGLGIDMEKHGSKLFHLYETFHNNTDAIGIGLFITKNQVEAMQGSIKVESTVNEGTKFIIKLTK